MQIGFLYSLFPVLILEKELGKNENYIFLIKVSKESLIKDKHYELGKAKQLLRSLGLNKILWNINKEKRLSLELEAFEGSYIHNPGIGLLNRIITYIYKELDLGLSRKDIQKIVFQYYM